MREEQIAPNKVNLNHIIGKTTAVILSVKVVVISMNLVLTEN